LLFPPLLRRLLAVALLIAGLAAVGYGYMRGWAPPRETFPVQGIDVSHHQGPIDWAAVRADGVDFAYIKASEGGDLRDPRFAENWSAAANAGLRRGAYHFFTLCRPARDQATNFIALVPREADALPPALDLEFAGNCAARPPRDALIAEVATFIRMVEAHSEKPVMLYITREFEEHYRVSAAIDRPLWLRRIFLEPQYGSHPWVMWQAHSRRRVAGVDGPVDWNVVRDE
jgi:lysozyme